MGYRSQVVLAISKHLTPFLTLATSQNADAQSLVFKHADTFDRDYGGDKSWLLVWDGIKWYDSYEGVSAIQDFIQWCDEETIPTGKKKENGDNEVQDASEFYRFVRIGEEMDDNEAQGWGFDIHIERTATY